EILRNTTPTSWAGNASPSSRMMSREPNARDQRHDLRALLRRPPVRPPLLAQLRDRGPHGVRDLALLPERRDHGLRLLGLEFERARLRDRLIEQRLLAVQALWACLHFRQH